VKVVKARDTVTLWLNLKKCIRDLNKMIKLKGEYIMENNKRFEPNTEFVKLMKESSEKSISVGMDIIDISAT
jgi:hypothetical protein